MSERMLRCGAGKAIVTKGREKSTTQWCCIRMNRWQKCRIGSSVESNDCNADSGAADPNPEMGDAMPDPANPDLSRPQPNPNEKLVKVFDTELEPEAMVVKGLLDSAGIDSDLTAAAMVQEVYPGLGGMIILVREEDADEARRLIAARATLSVDETETAEYPIIEEPPRKA